ncbi:DUF1553 domain-containing protein [Telmatocola sphagniphila]|uniref:DUF1553 domain-containing protein n=1 Tax=Telmatocola sphagniphila TaxID=1123043 RepID=A0A8E6B5N8_9BACT|nr:DUF1553 domain-containing protein [Telmatocola sphagniphila]QVL30860.1 DUF1553 domain-containing protein [Telmatocola sphagniphila]
MRFELRLTAFMTALLLAGWVIAQEPRDPGPIFRKIDSNSDGKLSLDEFRKLVENNPRVKDNPALAKQIFDRLDTNKDGYLSLEEFSKAPFLQGNAKGQSKKGVKQESSTKASDTPPSAEQVAFFEKKIRPVLIAECYSCHAADAKKIKGGLLLDTREATRKGGDTGPAVVPGDLNKSLLIKAIRYNDEHLQMPPKNKLSPDVVQDFETWVKMGAPDPRDGGAKAARTEIDIEKGRQFWSFQPPKKSAAPQVKDSQWAKEDLDRFVLAGLEAKGLKPVADAEPATLFRRLHLDLTGLPPAPEQVNAFLEAYASKPQATLEKTVDELLNSRHFGERWARHWLDVARYAESTGKSVNINYPFAWRYRDYVIEAFNADKPYDQFIREQIAGDLLPATDEKDKARKTVATGFLALGTKTLNERNRLQFELDVVDEQIDVVTQTFLGITAACARCHDHKFDPIPSKDYYALAGIFRSTETCYGTVTLIQARYPSALIQLPASVDLPSGLPPLSKSERETIEKQIKDFRADLGKGPLEPATLRARTQIALLEAKLAMYEKDGTPKKQAMGVREKFRTVDSPVYSRGEPEHPAEVVHRGVLQVVSKSMPTIQKGSGRKELADWIASSDNPLTARVYVNRIWLHLFGRGLVTTSDNFGATGQAPSNPELLDYLALRFIKEGWSTKKLIRELVLSHTYQLSSKFDAKNYDLDPDNVLLWRMTPARLDAEVLRDAMLTASGLIQLAPPQDSPTARAGEGFAIARRPGILGVQGQNDSHRSIYLPIIRDNLPEPLALFDAADASIVVGERANTTVPAQALFLMNSPFMIRQSEALGDRLLAASTTDSDRIRQAYLMLFNRLPNEKEMASAEEFIQQYGKSKKARTTWAAFSQAMLGSAEFLMRN